MNRMTDMDYPSIEELGIDKDLLALGLECMHSTKATAQAFFPDRFRRPFAPIHEPIFQCIDSPCQHSVVVATRGIGKTSIIALAYLARQILFKQRRFIIYITSSFDKAQLRTEELKGELLTNPRIRALFPSIKVSDPEIDIPFTKSYWVANNYTAVVPAGDDQNIRGMLFRNHRPDLIVLDDVEDKLTIFNENVRFKRRQWFFGDVLKATEIGSTTCKILVADSAKHPDSVVANLLSIPTYEKAIVSVCDDNYESLAPDFISTEKLREERDAADAVGMLHIWTMETMSKFIPISGAQSFDMATFVPYVEASKEFSDVKNRLISIVIHDPSKSTDSGTSHAATVGISCDLQEGVIYVRGVVAGKLAPDAQIDEDIEMARQIDAKTVAIEITGMSDWAKHPLVNRLNELRMPVQVLPINAVGDKNDRIRSLIPYHRYGYIKYNSTCIHQVKQQAIDFPGGIRNDILDALAHMTKIFYQLGIFIKPNKKPSVDGVPVTQNGQNIPALPRKRRPNIQVV